MRVAYLFMNLINCIMTKIRVLSIGIVCLMILNITLIIVVFIGGPKPFKAPRNFIIEKLEFTPTQVLMYEDLIVGHQASVSSNEKEIKNLKKALYETLITNDKIRQLELLNEISKSKQKIELIHLKHFEEIKGICKPEQQEQFMNLIEDLPRLFAPPGHNKRR